MFLNILIAIFLAIICCYLFVVYRYQYFKRQGIPCLRPKIFFGNIEGSLRNRRNIVYDIDEIYKAFKHKAPFCGFFSSFRPYILAIDPALIRTMFIKDFSKFRNNDFFVNEKNDPIMARNPFWMRDEAWKEKRAEVIAANSTVKLKAMYPLITDAGKNMTDFIAEEISKKPTKAFDSRDISARYTCESICSTTFGCEAKSFSEDKPFFLVKGRELIRGIADSFQAYLPRKMLPGPIENFFIELAKEAIKTRTERNIKQEDFLAHTIELKNKKNMSDIDAAAHCVTLFLDGYETTSVTLHHALYELGYDKRVQVKLRDEILGALGNDEYLTYDKLLELPYLNQVFYETMRLHPPLVLTTRWSSEDWQYEGYDGKMMTIKKDMPIWIPIPSIQRDADHFTDPDKFNPDRFDPEFGGVKAFKDKGVLIPFGDGPRICSGMRFAYMQVKAAIAQVVAKFEISIDKCVPDQMKHPEAFLISPLEFLNVPYHKLYLNFKQLDKLN